jgi:hypothetical protein
MLKLYEVRIVQYGIVLANSRREAENKADEIRRTERPAVIPYELDDGSLPFGWDEDTLVYHAGKDDLTLAEARKKVIRPEDVANMDRRWGAA